MNRYIADMSAGRTEKQISLVRDFLPVMGCALTWLSWLCENFGRLDGGTNHSGEAGIVALIVALRGGLVHLLAGDASPIDTVAGFSCPLADKLALRASVAFPEGMKSIQLPQVMRRAASKGFCVEALEMIFGGQFHKGLIDISLHKLDHCERVRRRAREVDLAQLSRPGVDVLEDAAMNFLQVGFIE